MSLLEIKQTLEVMVTPGDVVELRIFDQNDKKYCGWFTDLNKMAEAALSHDDTAEGTYYTCNACVPDMIGIANNRIRPCKTASSEKNMLRRRIIGIDIDPRRNPVKISSTDEEHNLAIEKAYEIRDWLKAQGWSDPVLGDSGNGAHLDYFVDLPVSEDIKILYKRLFVFLKSKFSNDKVDVQGFEDANRVWKLYGTMVRKGENLPNRPHRKSAILEMPKERVLINLEQIKEIASNAPEDIKEQKIPTSQPQSNNKSKAWNPEKLKAWLDKYNIEIARTKTEGDKTYFILKACVFNPDHAGSKEAEVHIDTDGVIGYKCHHDSCKGKRWIEARELFEPNYKDKWVKNTESKMCGDCLFNPRGGAGSCRNPENEDKEKKQKKQVVYDDAACDKFKVKKEYIKNTNVLKQALGVFKDKIELANEMQKRYPIYYDKSRNYWLWIPDQRYYRRIDETDVLNCIRHNSSENVLNSAERNEILTAIQLTGRERAVKEIPETWIQFKNCVIDYKTDERLTATPEYFFASPIPHNLGDSRDTPTIDRIFKEWMGDEAYKLVELAAYILSNRYIIHRLFFLFGKGRNGKGQYMEFLERFAGSENTTTVELEKLIESRFEASKLYTKRVGFVGEANFGILKNTAALKKLTGDDKIGGEFKHKDPFDFWNGAKLIIAANSLPTTLDKTDAFYARCIVYEFKNQFPLSKKIVDSIPESEYENFSLKCIELLPQLLDQGAFTNEGTIEQKAENYEKLSNPISQFIEQYCIKDGSERLPAWRLLEEYNQFAKNKGFRELTKTEFNDRLKEKYELEKKNIDGNNWVWVFGLKFKDENTPKNDTLRNGINENDSGKVRELGKSDKQEQQPEHLPELPKLPDSSLSPIYGELSEKSGKTGKTGNSTEQPNSPQSTSNAEAQRERTKPSYLCEHGQHDGCGGFGCGCARHQQPVKVDAVPGLPAAKNDFSAVEKAGREWEQINGQNLNSSNIVAFSIWYCQYHNHGSQPSEIRCIAEKLFKLTPELTDWCFAKYYSCEECSAYKECPKRLIPVQILLEIPAFCDQHERVIVPYLPGDMASISLLNVKALIQKGAAKWRGL